MILPRKILAIFVILLMFSTIAHSISARNQNLNLESENLTFLKKSYLKKIDDLKIVYLNGSFYEMGYQKGSLLKNEIIQNIRAFLDHIDNYDELLEQWNREKKYTAKKILDFIDGIANAIGIENNTMGCIWIWDSYLYGKMNNPWNNQFFDHCCTFAAFGSATLSGELIHGHSFDMNIDVKDPITGTNILENPVIIVCDPDKENSFVYPSFPGFIASGGVNEKGISISMTGSFNNDEKLNGSSYNTRIFEALYSSSDIKKAIDVITRNETYGLNYLISNGYKSKSYIVEQTANITYIGTWNNTVESNYPFFEMENVLRRTNLFINRKTAEKQRKYFHPADLRYLFSGKVLLSYPWFHYKALSKSIEKNRGNLDFKKTMEMFRDVYDGKYNLIWHLFRLMKNKPIPWFQWACCPKTGDMIISFTGLEKNQNFNRIYNLNLSRILKKDYFSRSFVIKS